MPKNEIGQTFKPGDDFYAYVNQAWIDENEIPANKSRYGAFTILNDENTERLRTLLESPAKPGERPNIARVKTFYRAAMDEVAIEKLGTAPVRLVLDMVSAIDNRAALMEFIVGRHSRGLSSVWHIGLDVDDKDSQRYVIRIDQSGLGLPDRDYFFEEGEKFDSIRAAYLEFLTKLFGLLSADDATRQAQNVYDLERKLAEASDTALQRRDPVAKYNLYSIEKLGKDFPGIEWPDYIPKTGFEVPKELLISQPNFITTALAMLEAEDVETWKSYFTAHAIMPLMSALPKAFDELSFNFYGKVLSGATEQEPRYRRAISVCMGLLPEPTGQLYAEAHFDEKAKENIYDLVGHIQAAMRKRIGKLEWMTDATKEKALEKLETFVPLLGYPDTWRPYESLVVGNAYAENFMAALEFEWKYDTKRLNGPVNRTEWLMSPAMVNAYYWSNTNGITFPAGILQPPFFDPKGDFAANYGGIGMVIGHEITHGFDDKGAKFDKVGNLNSWWTDEDEVAFEARGKQLEVQYSEYEINGRHVNGALTLGENIADLGGALIAFDALKEKMLESGYDKAVDGFTPEQRFLISMARIWREKIRPEMALRQLVSDSHSPAKLRVNGVVTNLDPFYEAFDVSSDDALYKKPSDRIRIW